MHKDATKCRRHTILFLHLNKKQELFELIIVRTAFSHKSSHTGVTGIRQIFIAANRSIDLRELHVLSFTNEKVLLPSSVF